MRFSVVMSLYKKNDYVKKNIETILGIDYDDFELILVKDKNYKVSKINNKKIRVFSTGIERTSAPEKRDLALKKARGDIIVFIDDDAYPKKDWLKRAEKHFEENKKLTALGGPGIPAPTNNLKEKISGLILSSRLGTGPFANRYSVRKKSFVDEFPCFNLFIKTEFLRKIGGFNTKFYSGDDTKVAFEITSKGGEMLYVPDVIVYHKSRTLFKPLLKQISNYGLHRGYFFKRFQENSFKIWFLLPSLLVLSLSTVLFNYNMRLISILIGTYFILMFLAGIVKTRRIKEGLLFLLGVFLMHATYGIYFIIGLFTKNLDRY